MSMELFTRSKADQCAKEIITWMLKNEFWQDTSIYVNNKRYSCQSPDGHYHYDNTWDCVFVENDIDPKDYLEYTSDFLTMTFEGPLYDILNYNYSAKYCDRYIEAFNSIINKYHMYYELGYSWSLALYKS